MAIRSFSLAIFPILLVTFFVLYRIDPFVYRRLLVEDQPVEWMTVVFLCLSGFLSLRVAFLSRERSFRARWFFVVFGVMSFGGAVEELSWGQRIFDIDPPEFIRRHSDQQDSYTGERDISVHNVLQKWTGAKTKHATGILFFLYGVCLPCLAVNRRFRSFCQKGGLVIPPLFLSGGFAIAALLMLDFPTGEEEEIGELLGSLCFVILMTIESLNRPTSSA